MRPGLKKRGLNTIESMTIFMTFLCTLFLFCTALSSPIFAATVIERISIRGNFPIFKKELRRVIDIRIGEEYEPERVNNTAKKIERIYQDEGYDQARVEILIRKRDNGEKATIIFVIHKGPRTRIGEVAIIDDRPDEKPDIKRMLGLRAGRVFKRKRLKERLKNLEQMLVSLGYLKADVRYLEKLDNNIVKLNIYVHRGQLLSVKIEGNRYFSKRAIINSLSFYENRFFDSLEIEESVRRIKDLYLDEGFLDVQVDAVPKGSEVEKGDRNIIFTIREGGRTYLKKITFEDNEHIKVKRLKRQFLSLRSLSLFRPRAYKALTFAEDLKAVEALYRSEGFPDVKVSSETEELGRRYIKKRIIIQEGIRLRVRKINFYGNTAFSDRQLIRILRVSEGSPLYPQDFREDRRQIAIFYSNNGYPYAKVSVSEEKDEESGLVDIAYNIEEGPFVRFGKLFISRNIKTKEKVIRLACTFKEGDQFGYQKIVDTQERLSNLGLFRTLQVEPKGLDEAKEQVDCLIEVEEMETGQVNFGAGFSSRVGYRGYIELREDNLRGRAISASFRADFAGFGKNYNMFDEIGRSAKYTVTFRDPLFIPRHKVEGEGKLFTMTEDRREYHTRSNSLSLGIWRPYKRKKLRVGLTYHIDLNRLKDITIDPNNIPKEYEEHTISAIGPTIIYDSRDDFMDPHKGIYSNFALDWAGGWVGGDQDFYKAQAELRAFLPVSRKLVIALGVRGGYIGLYGRTGRAPIQEMFFAGGGNTVRGFKEDFLGPVNEAGLPLGGRVFWVNNIELRYTLYRRIKGIIFFDAGNVWEKSKYLDANDLRRGTGIGLRWITPIGLVRLDYGIAINRRPIDPKSRAYLSIGHAF